MARAPQQQAGASQIEGGAEVKRTLGALCGASVFASVLAVGIGTSWATETVTTARVAGADRHATAAAVARAAFGGGAASAVLARSDAFPDALAGSFLAGATSGPVLLTVGDQLSAATRAALADLGVETVHVLGGTAAISPAVTTALAADGYTVRRVAGANRYETAALIARAGTVGQLEGTPAALLAGGADFPDALAAGPVAYAAGLPILLTAADELAPESAAAIEDLGIGHVVVLGGTAAVSDAVVAQVAAVGATSERIAGNNRFETAAAIADFAIERLGWAGTAVGLARGDAFPDGLAGGPHGGRSQAPILLTAPDALSAETSQWLGAHTATVATVTALGGTAAVSDAALGEARRAAGDPSGSGGFAVVGGAATAEFGEDRACRVITEPDATIQLRLLPSSFVTGLDGQSPTFRDDDADGIADAGVPRAGIRTIEGRTLSPPLTRVDDQRSDGDLAVGVGSDEYDSVVLVAFLDAEKATPGELDVDAEGSPIDEVVIGCRSTFGPGEAPAGAHPGVEVGAVDAAHGIFFDDEGERMFRFDPDDTYLLDGASSSASDFTALLGMGDIVDVNYVRGEGESSFDVIEDIVLPAQTPDAASSGRDVTVSFEVPTSNGAGTRYRIFRVRTHPEGDGCSPDSYAETGSTIASVEHGPYVDSDVADGCYVYRVITVASSGETATSGFSPPVKVPSVGASTDTARPTSVYAAIDEGGTVADGLVGAGDTVTIVFGEPMAAPEVGASFTVASDQGTATFTNGSGATFALSTSTRTVGGSSRPPETVLTITISANPSSQVTLPATIVSHGGITDRAGNTWDVVSSSDRTLEAS